MRYILLLLLVPLFSRAQTTNPVVSEDYIRLVRKVDTTSPAVYSLPQSSAKRDVMRIIGNPNANIRDIKIINNHLKVTTTARELQFTGNFRTSATTSWANRQPALQNQYAQGLNNQWMGPETNTLFSFGPAISSLTFDGSNYPYDKNGKLTTSGNGQPANTYNNDVLRRGVSLNNDFLLRTAYLPYRGHKWVMDLKVGQQYERSIIVQNNNNAQHGGILLNHEFGDIKVNANYDYSLERFDHSNRNWFLNRVYQYALLTPVSFENAQGTRIGNAQRSYSNGADNPLFLLQNDANGFRKEQQRGSIKAELNHYRFKVSVVPTIQRINTYNTEAYAAGTTGFEEGIVTRRQQHDKAFFIKGNVNYRMPNFLYSIDLRSTVDVDYNYAAVRTDINYGNIPGIYQYQRRTHEPSVQYNANFSALHMDIIYLILGNQAYISNTTDRQSYWLPNVGFKANKHINNLQLSISSNLKHFNTELPFTQSMAALNLLKYTANTLPSFLPVTEVNSFNNLHPVEHREWTSTFYLLFKSLYFTTNYTIRATNHDVLPLLTADGIQLKNIADHVNKGVEINLSYTALPLLKINRKYFTTTNSLSFTSFRNRITSVEDGYNYTPTAGLSNVYTAVVKDAPAGSIVANTGVERRVIGNPNPDFILNLNNDFNYGDFSFSLGWQWRKGGQMWNGTAAILDYYGRSATSALQRKEADGPRTDITGVAASYLQRADAIRLNNITLAWSRNINGYVNKLKVAAFVHNILLWTPYKGVDPRQTLLDQGNISGLDLFNLPATTAAGIEATINF